MIASCSGIQTKAVEGIKLLQTLQESEEEGHESDEDDPGPEIFLGKGDSIAFRWKRVGSGDVVFVETSAVPAAAIPMSGSGMLYCVCANALELRGGGLRAEGLTLLPQGEDFLLLSRYSFGRFSDDDDVDEVTIAEEAVTRRGNAEIRQSLVDRVARAVSFHRAAMELGESLECFPEKVVESLRIFDGVDGYESWPWEALESNPFSADNLRKHRKALESSKETRLSRRETSGLDNEMLASDGEPGRQAQSARATTRKKKKVQQTTPIAPSGISPSRLQLSDSDEQQLFKLLENGYSGQGLGSARLLSLIVEEVRSKLSSDKEGPLQDSFADWVIHTVKVKSRLWFKATFNASDLPYLVRTSTKNKLPGWLKQTNSSSVRPASISEALNCLPPSAAISPQRILTVSNEGLFFDSLALAVQMEASFWLERQFMTQTHHWYVQDVVRNNMARRLLQVVKAANGNGRLQQKTQKSGNPVKVEVSGGNHHVSGAPSGKNSKARKTKAQGRNDKSTQDTNGGEEHETNNKKEHNDNKNKKGGRTQQGKKSRKNG